MGSFNDWLKNKQNEAFVHSAEDGKGNFAMAVYSIMHNQASATDWEIIDSVSPPVALEKIKNILSMNGVEGEDLDREMEWWKQQISSTAKWN